MSRRTPLIVAGWLAAAAAAVVSGLAGVQVIGGGITAGAGTEVLTPAEAAAELSGRPAPAASGPGSEAPTPSASVTTAPSSPPPAGPTNLRSFTGAGGSVVAGCTPAGAKLVSWMPAQGYAIERYDPGPGEYAEVRFRSGSGKHGHGNGEVRVRVRCADGVPFAEWR
jgi:serine/threonine-protein kinase